MGYEYYSNAGQDIVSGLSTSELALAVERLRLVVHGVVDNL